MKFEYDVVIVGGGPAGSTAGYILSRNSIDVLVIDKFKFPREKLCGGLLSNKAVKILREIFDEDVKSLKEKDLINFETKKYEIVSDGKIIGNFTSKNGFYFVERAVFDHYFIQKAKNSGADILEGDGVISVDLFKNEVKTISGKIFKGKYIIGADGVNSIIRKNFPEEFFKKDKWKKNLASAYEVFIDRKDLKFNIDHLIIFFKYLNFGYGWLFPNNEKILIGVGGLIRKNNEKIIKYFNEIFQYLNLDGDILKEKRIKGHLLPFGNFLMRTIFNKTFLIGDSAGFVNPLSGDGLYYSYKSAKLTAEFILGYIKEKKKNLESSYTKMIFKKLYLELIYLSIVRNLFYSYIKYFPFFPIKLFLKK